LGAQHPKIFETIVTKRVLDDDLKAALDAAIKAFKPLFRPE